LPSGALTSNGAASQENVFSSKGFDVMAASKIHFNVIFSKILFPNFASANGSYSDESFKQKFGFAFNLLIDAELQIQNLKPKAKSHARPDGPDF
jgi:hypothetical protein